MSRSDNDHSNQNHPRNPVSHPIHPAIFYRICRYSTISTADAAYIIGGQTTDYLGVIYVSVVAEYKNDVWSKAGELLKGRYAHGSIVNGLETMVIGGYVSRGS